MRYDDDYLKGILQRTKVIACVGASAKPERASFGVSNFMRDKGYRVIPVNPGLAGQTLCGETVVASLADIPADAEVDFVDVFRRSEAVVPVVEGALTHLPNLKTIWMQLGVINPEAAAMAEAHGIDVVQDRCPKPEYGRLIGRARVRSS